ncbi:hypothetical protein H2200_003260 [Cladophialophora chaetospira]|uniref:Uncharacterized protein n=1 Tax=Cladophialophora chaetospira TaxID=386627 RepID=A0AA38XH04_9EURO|nr:hypothetical protein H2200_003260 [Cladophialophora chaetospira]
MFFAGRRNSWVERGPDGHLQEARYAPAEDEARVRARAGDREKRPEHEVVIEVDREHARLERDPEVTRLRQSLPSFQQVERLLDLYVATGEGRGAYVKATKQVEQERRRRFFEEGIHDIYGFDEFDGYDDFGPRLGRRTRPPGYGLSMPRRPPSESSHSSDDDHYRGGGRVPDKPSGGGPSAGPRPELIIDQSPPRRRGPASGRPRRTVTIVPTRTDKATIRRLDPSERPAEVVHDELRVEEVRERDELHPEGYLGEPAVYRGSHRYRRPTVHELSSDEGDLDLVSLPSEEDDVRLHPRSRNIVRRDDRLEVVRMPSIEREPDARRQRSVRRADLRGGEGPDESTTSRPSARHARLRGGGPFMKPSTKTSAVAAGVVEDYDIRSKAIILYFFTVNRGRIISSRHAEIYRTFRELYAPQFPTDIAHRSDSWLVQVLKKHYWMISRESRRSIMDLFSMRTIGFATFIRFERTVKATHDSGNFIVTARAPAISAEGSEAVSHFVYMMRYPLQKSKMMLFLLDRLAGTTRRGSDHNTFYVVELKETFDTSKIYILLAILIIISTGAGVLYAVLKSDAGTGLSIASYILTCLSLILAVVAAGEWLGITKPDAFSFAYDWVDNRVVSRGDFGRIIGGRWGG